MYIDVRTPKIFAARRKLRRQTRVHPAQCHPSFHLSSASIAFQTLLLYHSCDFHYDFHNSHCGVCPENPHRVASLSPRNSRNVQTIQTMDRRATTRQRNAATPQRRNVAVLNCRRLSATFNHKTHSKHTKPAHFVVLKVPEPSSHSVALTFGIVLSVLVLCCASFVVASLSLLL